MSAIRNYRTHPRTGTHLDFSKLQNGIREMEEAVLELDKFKRTTMGATYGNKEVIMSGLERQDTEFLRELSLYYMGISGIYQRIVEYMSTILTYDWLVYPYMIRPGTDPETVKDKTQEVLEFLDNLFLSTTLAEITRTIVIEGSYYGYFVTKTDKSGGAFLQLPSKYCRSRMNINGLPAVEFNLKYFDDTFRDDELREAVLKTFPEEFQKHYRTYKNGGIAADPQDRGFWFLCDPNFAMKFSITDNDVPLFAAVIPTIINLDEAKQLDLKKTTQELLKIIIHKMPLDRQGDLIFDIEESLDMHNVVAHMLSGAPNIDLLTTFADVEVADLDNSTATSNRDPLAKVERGIFNEAGVSQHLFATDGNLSLEKSITNDEALMFKLLDEYQNRLNAIIKVLFEGEVEMRISFPYISFYNQEKKHKMYKEMATNGYSKILPAVASGMSQSEFLSLNYFEEEVLDLSEKLIPVQSSNTMSSKDIGKDSKGVGAPKKEEGELAEKTIQNKESMD